MRNALEVETVWFSGAWLPRRSRSSRLQVGGDEAEQAGLWTGGGEGQANARDGFDDAGAELEEPEAQRCELGDAGQFGQCQMAEWRLPNAR